MVAQLRYSVSMKPETHYYEVTIQSPISSANRSNGIVHAVMPSWTPGSYLIREFARNVLDFKAVDAETRTPLVSYKSAKNIWNIELPEAKSAIEITYRVYAFEYTVDTSYLDEFHGVINGASVFMYIEGLENVEHYLTINLPSNWSKIATSLDSVAAPDGHNSSTFTAPNFDILVDSPLELGNQEIRTFEVEGVAHEVSLFGSRTINNDEFVSDLKKIVDQTWRVIGTIPYRRYLFLVDFAAGPRGGGLEHLSSTHCIVPRYRLMPRQEYHLLLGLFSHELFHAWNVKRMRPSGLGPFNYSTETYTKSLWIAEGITSYYDDLILRRAGIYSPADYFDALCLNIDYLKSLPSSSYESAEESSFNTWIGQYRPDENSVNVHSSYYQQGAVIGWMLDMEIRKYTNNSRTLDDALKKLYNESFVKESRGYSEEELERICTELGSPAEVKLIFDSRVRGREPVDFDKYLQYAGLRLDTKSKKEQPKGYLGFKTRTESGRVIVASRLFGSPAESGGIASGDEIVAVNNFRIDSLTLPFLIANSKPNEEISLLVARDGVMHTLSAKVADAPQFEHRISKIESASEMQKRLFQGWMNASWDEPLEYVEYTPSPLKMKTFDFI